jgi:chorismate-pyruvate lyase
MRRSSNLQRATVQNAAQRDRFAAADPSAGDRPTEIAPRGRVVRLDPFLHRALLATDGTVTNLIESFLERVMIEKLGEETGTAPISDWPGLPAGMPIVRRTVLIRGVESGHIFLHAESLLILERLEPSIRRDLFETEKPIGKLIREHRCESFRELLG